MLNVSREKYVRVVKVLMNEILFRFPGFFKYNFYNIQLSENIRVINELWALLIMMSIRHMNLFYTKLSKKNILFIWI